MGFDSCGDVLISGRDSRLAVLAADCFDDPVILLPCDSVGEETKTHVINLSHYAVGDFI